LAPLPKLDSKVVDLIFETYEKRRRKENRAHLGASEIGNPCERALWYSFRWVSKKSFPGRVLRLFETGQLQEVRMAQDLRSIGVDVMEFDDATGQQFQVEDVDRHFGGSMDGVLRGLPEDPGEYYVAEYKTHNRKSFLDLKIKGVKLSKPLHYAQMMIYMYLGGLEKALYMAVNKDTDDLYTEVVHVDVEFAERLIEKARRVIKAKLPPAGISTDPAWWECRFCSHHEVCHYRKGAQRNCRTCIHSTPIEQGQWSCALATETIPPDVLPVGCPEHRLIPTLVPGEQIDVDGTGIVYRLRDGTTWTDEGNGNANDVEDLGDPGPPPGEAEGWNIDET
jgi:CRISPR/Cas system-associated exonuclease Cas4 (RecB family)